MISLKLFITGRISRLIVASLFASVLMACSSSSDTTPVDNPLDIDVNGDGIRDNADDINGDGLVDQDDIDAFDSGFGVVLNPDDIDVNGDGVRDDLDDINLDGVVDQTDLDIFEENNPSADPNANCDANSENDDWSDNCLVAKDGINANSSYAEGIQRILWCLGYGQGVADVDTFADGIFGQQTFDAVLEFQQQEDDVNGSDLVDDGKVGPRTWATLREALVVDPGNSDGIRTGYKIQSALPGCDRVNFYQSVAAPNGWSISSKTDQFVLLPFDVGS